VSTFPAGKKIDGAGDAETLVGSTTPATKIHGWENQIHRTGVDPTGYSDLDGRGSLVADYKKKPPPTLLRLYVRKSSSVSDEIFPESREDGTDSDVLRIPAEGLMPCPRLAAVERRRCLLASSNLSNSSSIFPSPVLIGPGVWSPIVAPMNA
jgi:hypothetical protein